MSRNPSIQRVQKQHRKNSIVSQDSYKSQKSTLTDSKQQWEDEGLVQVLESLSTILSNDNHSHILCWTNSGRAFNIKDKTLFIKDVLPKIFGHQNFPSFVRQMKGYGFKQLKRKEGLSFYLRGFQKSRAHTRNRTKSTTNSIQSYDSYSSAHSEYDLIMSEQDNSDEISEEDVMNDQKSNPHQTSQYQQQQKLHSSHFSLNQDQTNLEFPKNYQSIPPQLFMLQRHAAHPSGINKIQLTALANSSSQKNKSEFNFQINGDNQIEQKPFGSYSNHESDVEELKIRDGEVQIENNLERKKIILINQQEQIQKEYKRKSYSSQDITKQVKIERVSNRNKWQDRKKSIRKHKISIQEGIPKGTPRKSTFFKNYQMNNDLEEEDLDHQDHIEQENSNDNSSIINETLKQCSPVQDQNSLPNQPINFFPNEIMYSTQDQKQLSISKKSKRQYSHIKSRFASAKQITLNDIQPNGETNFQESDNSESDDEQSYKAINQLNRSLSNSQISQMQTQIIEKEKIQTQLINSSGNSNSNFNNKLTLLSKQKSNQVTYQNSNQESFNSLQSVCPNNSNEGSQCHDSKSVNQITYTKPLNNSSYVISPQPNSSSLSVQPNHYSPYCSGASGYASGYDQLRDEVIDDFSEGQIVPSCSNYSNYNYDANNDLEQLEQDFEASVSNYDQSFFVEQNFFNKSNTAQDFGLHGNQRQASNPLLINNIENLNYDSGITTASLNNVMNHLQLNSNQNESQIQQNQGNQTSRNKAIGTVGFLKDFQSHSYDRIQLGSHFQTNVHQAAYQNYSCAYQANNQGMQSNPQQFGMINSALQNQNYMNNSAPFYSQYTNQQHKQAVSPQNYN
eukprot:403335371